MLHLVFNLIENVPRDAFANNKNLTKILLNSNELVAIENGCFLDSLTMLDLDDNKISSLNFESFNNLKNLQILNIDENPLNNLEVNTFEDLLELKELTLLNTSFKEFPQLSKLRKLEEFKVGYQIDKMPRAEDALTSISPSKGTFLGLPNLKILHLQNLGLTDFPQLKRPLNLIDLNLSGNKIKNISYYVSQFAKLKILRMGRNYLTEIDDKIFARLPNLAWLDLSDNIISLNTQNNHSAVPNITLNIQSPFKANLQLQKLILANNRIESIYIDWRKSLKYLNELDLRGNNITHLSASDFSFAQKNVTVRLDGNPIIHINMSNAMIHLRDPASGSKRTVNIILGSTIPLNCDCNALYLKRFRSNTYKINSNNVTCASPNNLNGLHLKSVPDKYFRCRIKNNCPFGCECWQRRVDVTILIDCSNRSVNISKLGLPNIDNIDILRDVPDSRLKWKLELDLSGNKITELTNGYASTLSPHLKLVNLSDNQLTSLSFLRALKNNSATIFNLAHNPFLCEDCDGFQNEWRKFASRLDVDRMTCIIKKITAQQLSLIDALKDRLCPETGSSNQSQYYIIIGLSFLCILALIILYFFQEKIKRQREMKEIIDLLNGTKTYENNETEDPLHFLFDENYEIKKNSFLIDKTCILGKGEFGEVYKGLLQKVDKKAAFKTVRSDRGTGPLRALVSEAKILMYIGHHEHLVTLLGVYREEITSGTLYVAIEFCHLGSLESFLKTNKSFFPHGPISNAKIQYVNLGAPLKKRKQNADAFQQSLCNIKSLLMWSEQIASAMEYLGTKNVIHSDLATRNVLLTAEGNAKVTDFGLSRRTYNYTEYIKTAKDPLPWRWLAIESLTANTFSEKSDVWAYGITLWEIFSLGDIPYPGMAPTMEFVQELQNGLRNFKPKMASDEIYDIMIRCWDVNPEERPTFSSMEIIFNYAVSNGTESLVDKVCQERSLDDIALQIAAEDYTIMST